MARLAAEAGIDPVAMRLTYFQLLQAVEHVRKIKELENEESWNRTALVCATLFNSQGGVEGKAVSPLEFTAKGQRVLKKMKSQQALMGVDSWFDECEREEANQCSQ